MDNEVLKWEKKSHSSSLYNHMQNQLILVLFLLFFLPCIQVKIPLWTSPGSNYVMAPQDVDGVNTVTKYADRQFPQWK